MLPQSLCRHATIWNVPQQCYLKAYNRRTLLWREAAGAWAWAVLSETMILDGLLAVREDEITAFAGFPFSFRWTLMWRGGHCPFTFNSCSSHCSWHQKLAWWYIKPAHHQSIRYIYFPVAHRVRLYIILSSHRYPWWVCPVPRGPRPWWCAPRLSPLPVLHCNL